MKFTTLMYTILCILIFPITTPSNSLFGKLLTTTIAIAATTTISIAPT